MITTVPGEKCIDPPGYGDTPAPPEEHNLTLAWNPTNPPDHGKTVIYNCSAGGTYNRRKDNFDLTTYTLTCLKDNKFSTPAWPTCADSK